MTAKACGTEKDQQILQLLRECPEQGFRMLFDVYHKALCLYVMQLTDSFQLAEDVVQDFFLLFWERKYYRGITGNFRSYLYTSVHNAALETLKKKKLISTEELTGIAVEIPDEVFWEREELEEHERQLMQRLEQLPRQEYAAIRLVVLENRKCVEAAEELHISVNTLKTHLSRGLKKLRRERGLFLLILHINSF